MYGTMSMAVLEQREEESNRLKKALRVDHKRPATSRWGSTVAWEPARAVGSLCKVFKAPKNAD